MAETKIQNNENYYQGAYPNVFKKIDSADVKVTPFQAFKSWTFVSGSTTSSMLPLHGVYTDINYLPPIDSELTFNDASNIDGSLQSITYFSINHLFYKRKNQPAYTFGPTDLNRTKKFLYQSASILSIPQVKIGEEIKPSSFSLSGSFIAGAVYGSSSYYGTSSYGQITNLYIKSDRYGNLYNTAYDTTLNVSNVKFYEGFNEYFDTSRITYKSENVTYVAGITATTGQQDILGLSAKFNGNGFIDTTIDGLYDRDNNYAISFFISSSNTGITNQLILTKASSSTSPTYPFKIELSGSNQLIFSAAGSDTFKTQITSSTAVTSSWYHVVCQKSGSSLQMYINNTLHASASSNLLSVTNSPFTASARIDNKDTLKIGGYSTNSSNVQGLIDEVRIFNKSLTSAEISALSDRSEGGSVLQTQYVGNIFNKHGIAVISSTDYRFNNIIYAPYTASYRSTLTINELSAVAKLDAGDFNMSTNITLTKDDDSTYYPFVSGSTFAPYITTIGLYNNFGELLAIAKLAQPIKKRNDVDMNFLIRLDLDKNITFRG
jgi:hypothetical protein